MKTPTAVLFAAIAANVCAAPVLEERATPRIFLIGDSTMAPHGGGADINGTASIFTYDRIHLT